MMTTSAQVHSPSKQTTLVRTFLISAEKGKKIGINLVLHSVRVCFMVCVRVSVCVHSEVIIFPGSAEHRRAGLCVHSIRLIRCVQF